MTTRLLKPIEKNMTSKSELLRENKLLRERLDKEQSKETCYHCNGTGKRWTYGMDEAQSCCYCHGSGRL